MVKILILALFLAGCTTARGTFCEVAEPNRLSQKSVAALSDAEVAKLQAHNEKGERLCGWKP